MRVASEQWRQQDGLSIEQIHLKAIILFEITSRM